MRLYVSFAPLVTGAITAMILGVSCTRQPTLDEQRTTGLSTLTSQVDQAGLMTFVNEVVAEHQADTPIDCELFGLGEHRDDPESAPCHLTSTRARAYMRQKLESFGYTVTDQVSGKGGKSLTTTNLIAEKKGTKYPDEIIVLGAHFDAFFAAADDNTSGVALVLELARLVSTRSFERTIRFVGFDLEELALTGSLRYVEEHGSKENIVGGMIFDCVGFRRSDPNTQTSPPGLNLPSTADFIAVIADAQSASLADDLWLLNQRFRYTKAVSVEVPGRSEAPLFGDLLRSDHAPFWLADKPVLFLSDTANFRNAHYHKPSDTVATLDPEFLAQVTRLAAGTLAYWAGGMQ